MERSPAGDRLLAAHNGVLTRSEHPRSAINALLARQAIVTVHPGVFVAADRLWDRHTRFAAALVARPASVLWGRSAVEAIRAESRPFEQQERVLLAQPGGGAGAGLTMVRRRVSPALIREAHGLRCPSPAIVAVDLACGDEGRVAELFLREGLVRPDELVDALAEFSGQRGLAERRRVVVSCSDNPWSGGERTLQALLRDAGLEGWVANPRLKLGGFVCHPDLLFEARRLVVEFDGFEVHSSRQAFEADRIRQNRLVLAGYRVLRYTWRRLSEDPDGVVEEISAAVTPMPDWDFSQW